MGPYTIGAPVLVLNQNYEPINVCHVRRAVVLIDRGKAEMLINGNGEVRTPRLVIPAPSVIRLVQMVKRPLLQRRLSRRDVFIRDSYTCQYCGKTGRDLTLDHVVPRVRGGTHTWDNVVAACIPCNHRKASRTLKEAGVKLLKEPRAPRPNPYYIFLRRPVQEEWRPFMPWID